VLSSAMETEIFSSDPEHVKLRQALDRAWVDGDLTVPGNDPKGMSV
jgi:hypothetical protein